MLQVLTNLLTLKALSTPVEVYAGLAVVWLLMLIAGLASVASRRCSAWWKLPWVILLIGLPVAGMALYCFYCLWTADYSFLKVVGLGGRHQTKRMPRKADDKPKAGVVTPKSPNIRVKTQP